MLKIKNPKTGKIRFILLDSGVSASNTHTFIDVSTLSAEDLDKYGIKLEEVEHRECTPSPDGLSQDDLKFVRSV